MTNDKAISLLRAMQEPEAWDPQINKAAFEALEMAIEALNAQRKTGEWEPIVLTSYPAKHREKCSFCGFMKNKEAFRFCPICGHPMREKSSYEEFNKYGHCDTCDHQGDDEYCEECRIKYMDWSKSRDVIERILNKLPSTQPEIIRCKDCKHRGEKPIADGRYWCDIHDTFMYYCSDAERRSDV